MIKTIIFDIGNVLTAFAWKPFFESFGFEEATLAKIAKATVASPIWDENDRGVLTDEEILAGFIKNDPSIEKELRQVFANVKDILIRLDYAVPWIKELKSKGYQVLVLSNFSHKAYQDCGHALDFLKYVDGGILSFQEKLIKPDRAIYELLIERYHLIPSEAVFIDDLTANVEGARNAGLHSFVFHNQEQAIEELKALGVN